MACGRRWSSHCHLSMCVPEDGGEAVVGKDWHNARGGRQARTQAPVSISAAVAPSCYLPSLLQLTQRMHALLAALCPFPFPSHFLRAPVQQSHTRAGSTQHNQRQHAA
eukprot:349862-Chlamydomonas_euryale.AAC.6